MKKESILYFLRTGLQYYVFLFVAFLMPLTKQYLPFLMFLWGVTILLTIRKIKLNLLKKRWLLLLLPFIFYLNHAIGLIYSVNLKSGLFDLEVKLSILLVPISIIFVSDRVKLNYQMILKIFVIGNFIASIVCIYFAFKNSFQVNEFGNLIFEPSVWPTVTKDINFLQLVSRGLSEFSYTYLSKIHHPTYFSVYIIFSVVILVYFIKTDKRSVFLHYFLIIYFTLFLWLLGSRAAYLTYIICFMSYCAIIILKFKRYYFGFGILLLGVVLSLSIISNSRLNKNIAESVNILKNSRNLSRDSDIRLWLWKCGLEVFEENLLFGIGTGDINIEIDKKYTKYALKEAQERNLNVHNQYIDVAIKLGIIGLMIMLAWIIIIIVFAIREKQFLLFYFIIIIFINFFFESMLNTLTGISFIAFFYSLLNTRDEKIKQDIFH